MLAGPAVAEREPAPTAPPPPAGAHGPYRGVPPLQGVTRELGTIATAPASTGVAAAAIGLYFVGQLAAGLLIGAWYVAWDGSTVGPEELTIAPVVLLLAAVGGQVIGLAAALGFLRLRRVDLAAVVGATRPTGRLLLIGTGVGAGMLVAASIVVAGLMRLTGSEQPADQFLLDELTRGGASTLLAFVAAVVLAPLAEELLFRGLLFRALRQRRGVHSAALVSSVVFAVVHVDVAVSQPLALVGLILVGVVLAHAYERTGSLLVPIAGHAAFNGITLVVALVGDRLGIAMAAMWHPLGAVLGW
jgi:membrane protease YdiL (CAAX protease family)